MSKITISATGTPTTKPAAQAAYEAAFSAAQAAYDAIMADAPAKVGMVSKTTAERRAFLDRADLAFAAIEAPARAALDAAPDEA